MRLLLIEDDPAILRAITRIATKRGHTVLSCRTGEEGLRSILAQRPDVIVTDLGLPGMVEGRDILTLLCGVGCPTYVYTGDQDTLTEQECLAAGARRVWHKPDSFDTLLAGIEQDWPGLD